VIESASTSAPPVRTAVQRRGIERTQAILDSAEAILAEHGYAAATLKAIGEHAGIPTASLYHYFADRGQVEAELVRRHIPAIDERFAASLYGKQITSLRDGVDAMIDPLLTYFRENPGLLQLWFAGRSGTLTELGGLFDESWAERLWHFLIEHKLISATTPLFAVQLMFEVGDRLFDVAFRRSPKGDDTTIDEGRRMLTAYLTTYVP
jgi:AcrR family transcriptional regulator